LRRIAGRQKMPRLSKLPLTAGRRISGLFSATGRFLAREA
jgi:hypothetical protein